MKSMLKVLVIALTALAFSGVSYAADTATKSDMKAEKPKAEKPKPVTATGEVASVDSKAGMVTVKTKDKDLNLTTTSKAKTALGKVKVGDTVKVTYTEKDGKMVASSIAGVKGTEKKADTAMDKSKAMDKPEKKADEKKASTK